MPTIKQFLLPDPAEGLTEAEIVSWLVAVGDTVTINQPIVEIETAKSVVELPTPYAGVVVDIHVPAGQVAEVGTPIISIDVDPDGPAPASDPALTQPLPQPLRPQARSPRLIPKAHPPHRVPRTKTPRHPEPPPLPTPPRGQVANRCWSAMGRSRPPPSVVHAAPGPMPSAPAAASRPRPRPSWPTSSPPRGR